MTVRLSGSCVPRSFAVTVVKLKSLPRFDIREEYNKFDKYYLKLFESHVLPSFLLGSTVLEEPWLLHISSYVRFRNKKLFYWVEF
jgi:hypothetical protein